MQTYKFVKTVSFVIRYLVCFLTIEQIQIFEDDVFNHVFSAFFAGVLYFLFKKISLFLVRRIDNSRGDSDPTARSVLYFLTYIPLCLITWFILLLLTRFGVFPIALDFTFGEFVNNWFVKFAEWLQRVLFQVAETVTAI